MHASSHTYEEHRVLVKEENNGVLSYKSTTKNDGIASLLNSIIRTLGITGGLHTACSLAERVREVDVSFSHDGLVKSRKLADHLGHGLLQQVLLFALLYVLFTKNMKHSPTQTLVVNIGSGRHFWFAVHTVFW